MKERPILFGGPMVRAILAGQKTQTRRLVKPQPERVHEHMDGRIRVPDGWQWRECYGADDGGGFDQILASNCMYGAPGDRLWVKETHTRASGEIGRVAYAADGWAGCVAHDGGGGLLRIPHGWIAGHSQKNGRYFGLGAYGGKWRPSIHMPRWASRLTLSVTSVRAERLHDISEDDARAEGVEHAEVAADLLVTGWYRDAFAVLWDSINGKRGPWSSNPWVWCVSFEVVGGPEEMKP